MNVYQALNEMTKYIDENLENEISYDVLAKFLGVNVYTMQRVFSMLVGVSLADYIRRRRLSSAGYDLYEGGQKIIDIALKYQYENATSFSRAFYKFHGIKPSLVNQGSRLKNFPRAIFREDISIASELDYEIITLPDLHLYGLGIDTNNECIGKDAPFFFQKMNRFYEEKYGRIIYGMITYDNEREESQRYYCLYDKEISEFEHFFFPSGKWLRFRIASDEALEIQKVSHQFYGEFLPSCRYNLKELPELEYYHDGVTDFLVAIY